MKKEPNPLEQFDSLPVIEASPGWEARMRERLREYPETVYRASVGRWMTIAVMLLVVLNVSSIFAHWQSDRAAQEREAWKDVAAEFFILSSSSTY